MADIILKPAASIHGTIQLPGDKSISHRGAMLAAIAEGKTRIDNFATSADCTSTLSCLAKLGVEIERTGDAVIVHGVGKTGLTRPSDPLDCGNSGTTMRLMAGILAGQNYDSVLTGDESLCKRPMKRVIEPLTQMGARIDSKDGRAPLNISGRGPLKNINYRLPVASAQIKSCVLLAGLNAEGTTTAVEHIPTRDHTERMLGWFGAEVKANATKDGAAISVSGDSRLTARDLIVPGDISSAAFFMVAAACLPEADISLLNVGFNPSRRAIFEVLKNLGADVSLSEEKEQCNEPIALIRVKGGLASASNPHVLKGEIIANLIDEIPVLAVFGTQLEHGLEIRDAAELRVKESDRIASVVENLRRMGAEVTEFDDGFRVEKSDLKGAVIDSFGDHRIAMAFGIAALLADGKTEIAGADCADVSFPGFFDTLARVVNYRIARE